MFAQRLSELAQRLSERSPTPRATLSHVLMREALVALFYCCCPSRIPWHWHEARTRRGTRVARLSCRKSGAGGFHPPVSASAKYFQVQLPPWSPSGGYERCFFLLLWIYLDNSSAASAF